MAKYDYDVIIVGSGHNGLTSAGYLARAGLRVLVLERRGIVGGAVCTEEVIPGYKIDVGSSAHIMIHLTPVVRDLELEKHGLEYIDMDPYAFYPQPDGSGSISFYRDKERTFNSIASVSPRDAEAYRKFLNYWGPINEAVFDVFLNPPSVMGLFGTMAKAQAKVRHIASTMETVRACVFVMVPTYHSLPLRRATDVDVPGLPARYLVSSQVVGTLPRKPTASGCGSCAYCEGESYQKTKLSGL